MSEEPRGTRNRNEWDVGSMGDSRAGRETAKYSSTKRLGLCLGVLLLTCGVASAKIQVGVEDWGLGGAVKSGMWSPLYVELQSKGEDFEGLLEVEAESGQQVLPLFVKPILLVQDTPVRHWLYFRAPATTFRRSDCRLTWRVRDRRGRVVFRSRWERQNVLPSGDSVVAAVRVPDIAATGLGGLVDQESEIRTNVLLLSPTWLPDRTVGYAGADALVWVNPEPSKLVSVAQREAITEYVRQGGHLVLATGAGWQALTQSFLSALLPAQPVGSRVAAELPALTALGLPEGMRKSIVLLDLTEPHGEVLMRHGDWPIIVRGRAGAGRVTLIGFDPTKNPFAAMQGRKEFWADLLGIDTTRREQKEVGPMRNVSAPLMRALSDFPGFKPINFTAIGVFMLLYVIIIGPVDYFVLKRLKKLHWTWLTFPCVAVVASIVAFWAMSSGRVVGLHANSAALVDAASDGEEITGTTFMTMLSPRRAHYRVSLEGAASGAVLPREYEVLPGTRGVGLTQSKCYVLGAGELIDKLLVRVWDAQTFEASWRAPSPLLPEATLSAEADRLRGSVTNCTPDTLREVVVLFRGTAIPLGNLAPGQEVSLDRKTTHALATHAQSLISKKMRHGVRSWGRLSTNRGETGNAARWISLFSYSGAASDKACIRRWIGTDEEHWSAVFDLPGRLQLTGLEPGDRAILLYNVDKSFVDIHLADERPKRWDLTVVRMRVPVQRAADTEGE